MIECREGFPRRRMRIPMKRLFLLVMMVSLAALARADERTQVLQQALKDKGFYYGDVDGQNGPETVAAIRRYQIRQGLDVTGKLDAQTLASLNLGSNNDNTAAPSDDSAAAPQETQPPKSVVESDHDFLRRQPQAATPAPATEEETPQQPDQPDQPQPPQQPDAGQPAPPEYARFFRKTPYETAPPVVQGSTVHRAQVELAREGFYRGMADGQLSDSFSRALVAYQRDAEIAPTGRLDMETLSDMNLLPRRRVVVAPPAPYGYGQPGPYGYGQPMYRGVWVR